MIMSIKDKLDIDKIYPYTNICFINVINPVIDLVKVKELTRWQRFFIYKSVISRANNKH